MTLYWKRLRASAGGLSWKCSGKPPSSSRPCFTCSGDSGLVMASFLGELRARQFWGSADLRAGFPAGVALRTDYFLPTDTLNFGTGSGQVLPQLLP